MSLFNELKRRNVFRVGFAYVVIAWLIAQVADLVFDNITAPDWLMPALLFLLAAGLFLALFFAWAFEMTPEGIKREHEVDRSQSITPRTGRKLDFVIIGLLVLALGYFAYDKFVLDASRDAALIEATTQSVSEQAASDVAATQSAKSIAVLPFVNMSSDAEQEYFSDGLTEELLNLLSKIPQLRVTSRSSAFYYKGKEFKIADVGRELNVSNVLEGSVRKSGNQLRITAQLIETRTDTHLWSETYDRTLDNIFTIQDEIATAVVKQLKVKLLDTAPTANETDPEAYALFLQGHHFNLQSNEGSVIKAEAVLQQALEIDPLYAAALLELSRVYNNQMNLGIRPVDQGRPLVRELVNRALAIDPGNARVHAALGYMASAYDNDPLSAVEHMQRALELEPANVDVLVAAADMSERIGRLDDATAIYEFLLERDPVNARIHASAALNYNYSGRQDEAMSSLKTALALNPGNSYTQHSLAMLLLLKGEPQAALEVMEQSDSLWKNIGLPMIYYTLGRTEESDAVLAELIDQEELGAAYNIAYIYAWRGEADRAFEWLDKAVKYQDSGLQTTPFEPLFSNIHNDPRWLPFLERIGSSPEQLAAIEFAVTLPE